MNGYKKQFLGLEKDQQMPYPRAPIIVVPFPYEGGVSYGRGAARGPEAIIAASYFLELYDEILKCEPYKMGVFTLEPPIMPDKAEKAQEIIYTTSSRLLADDKFVISIGGDHSISVAFYKALIKKFGVVSVIQFDAHADLRDQYENSKFSHACVMARIRELTHHTLQIGIRSMSQEEAEKIKKENIALCTMHDLRCGKFDFVPALRLLPDPIFITFDVDVFDWSVVSCTGTPEPGGLLWDETLNLLQQIFSQKKVIGFDVVELAAAGDDRNSPFAVAKLIYKMIGYKFFPSLQTN